MPAPSYGTNTNSSVAGGGGTSAGGGYSVSGTLGQHDAGGPMTGNGYSLTGGFWALFAVQTPGAPVWRASAVGTDAETESGRTDLSFYIFMGWPLIS